MREKKNTSFYSKTKEKREKREREHQMNWLTDLCQNPPTIFHKQNPSALGLSRLITAQNHFFLYYGMFCVQCRCQKHSQNDTCLLQLHLLWIHTTSSEARDALNISIMYTLLHFYAFLHTNCLHAFDGEAKKAHNLLSIFVNFNIMKKARKLNNDSLPDYAKIRNILN